MKTSMLLSLDQRQYNWVILRRQGQSPVYRATLFFPVIAVITSLGAQRLEVLGYSTTLDGWFMFRMYLFYFSLLSMSLASFIYAWKCPTIIKDFPGAMVYVDQRLHTLIYSATHKRIVAHAEKYLRIYSENVEGYRSDASIDKARKEIENLRASIDEMRKISSFPAGDSDKNVIVSFMSSLWNVMNFSRSGYRIVTYALYRLGNVLFIACMVLSVLPILKNFALFFSHGLDSFFAQWLWFWPADVPETNVTSCCS